MAYRLLDDKEIRARFAELRKRLGSQNAVAARMGVSQPTISEWERGPGSIPKERLQQLADLAEESVLYLVLADDAEGADMAARNRLVIADWLAQAAQSLRATSSPSTNAARILRGEVRPSGTGDAEPSPSEATGGGHGP